MSSRDDRALGLKKIVINYLTTDFVEDVKRACAYEVVPLENGVFTELVLG